MKMEKKEKISLFFWLFLSLFFCVESWRLGLGNFHAPGPGFFPFGASLVIGLFVIVLFLKERGRRIAENVGSPFQEKKVRNLIYILGALFAYPVLLNKLGFFFCTALFVGSCIKIIGAMRWRSAVGISTLVAIVSYLLFVVWLNIQIPELGWVRKVFALKSLLWK